MASEPHCLAATTMRQPRCSEPMRTGATSCRSPGTSRQQRTRPQSGDAGNHHAAGPTRQLDDPRRGFGRRRGHRRLVHLRDCCRPRKGTSASHRRQSVDNAHDSAGAQGLRGEEGREPSQGCRTWQSSWPQKLAREKDRRRRATRVPEAALCRHCRWRPGRHRPGGAARRSSMCRRSSSRRTRNRATVGATATRASVCTIRSGSTISRTSRSQRTGPCSARRTRSLIGWKCTRR